MLIYEFSYLAPRTARLSFEVPQGKEEALMSLTMTIIMLISGWLAVATAMLWGVLRITRRQYHPSVQTTPSTKADKPATDAPRADSKCRTQ